MARAAFHPVTHASPKIGGVTPAQRTRLNWAPLAIVAFAGFVWGSVIAGVILLMRALLP